MKIITPSFIKIRVVVLLFFLTLCFFFGLLKGASAGWPGECSLILKKHIQTGTCDVSSQPDWCNGYEYSNINASGALIFNYVVIYDAIWKTHEYRTYYYEDGSWHLAWGGRKLTLNGADGPGESTMNFILPEDCGGIPKREKNFGPNCLIPF